VAILPPALHEGRKSKNLVEKFYLSPLIPLSTLVERGKEWSGKVLGVPRIGVRIDQPCKTRRKGR